MIDFGGEISNFQDYIAQYFDIVFLLLTVLLQLLALTITHFRMPILRNMLAPAHFN